MNVMASPYHVMAFAHHRKKPQVTPIRWQQYNCECNETHIRPYNTLYHKAATMRWRKEQFYRPLYGLCGLSVALQP